MFEIDHDDDDSSSSNTRARKKERKKSQKDLKANARTVLMPTHHMNEVALIIYLLMEQLETLI